MPRQPAGRSGYLDPSYPRQPRGDAYNTKADSTLGFCVYPYWHPSGRYIAYSTNNTRQGFHVQPDKIIEVFDLDSDIQVYDVERNELITAPQVKRPGIWETFPVFSPDGGTLYFTAAKQVEIPGELPQSRYNLMKVSFDPETGRIGDDVEMVVDAASQSKSLCFPRPSYDGKYLMYTLCDYGTFSIWHHESDLWLLDLETGETRPMTEVNSDRAESFHNWSSNSRWFLFTSRRENGLYTQVYLAHFDPSSVPSDLQSVGAGKATKPFLLPQRNPKQYYRRLLYSYNTPDFTSRPVETDARKMASRINGDERIPTKTQNP